VALSEIELTALAFLAETFVPSSVNGEAFQARIRRILDSLPESQRGSIEGRRQRWRIDLGRKDDDVILPQVQETIERAIAQHRLLRFVYLSLSYADGRPRVHKVKHGTEFNRFSRLISGSATPQQEDDWLSWRSAATC
jgi:hypothetical protein